MLAGKEIGGKQMRDVEEYNSGWVDAVYDEGIDSWRVYLHPNSSAELDDLWDEVQVSFKQSQMRFTRLVKRKGPPFYTVAWKTMEAEA
jgi:hypothetical protein